MASYPAPDDRRSDIFNETDYLTTPSELATVGEEGKYVKVSGDFMSGALSAPSLSTNELTFPTGVQTQPFTDVLKELVDTLKTKTQNLASPVLGVTEINGLTATNNLRLYNGSLTYADESVQTTAFTYVDRINLDNCTQKTSALAYDPAILRTSVANTFHATNLTAGNINTSFLTGLVGPVETRLGTHEIEIDDLQEDVSNLMPVIGQCQNITATSGATTFTGYVQPTVGIRFPDNTVQSSAFSADLYEQVVDLDIKVSLPMTNIYNSQMHSFDVDLEMPYTGSNFYTGQKSVAIGNVPPGVCIIQGVVFANRVNSLTKFVANFLMSTGNESQSVGWQFEASDTTWFYIRLPMMWIVSTQTGGSLTLEMDYSYRPNSDTRFSFKGNMIQFM
jgi:hypothetical protein